MSKHLYIRVITNRMFSRLFIYSIEFKYYLISDLFVRTFIKKSIFV